MKNDEFLVQEKMSKNRGILHSSFFILHESGVYEF